MPYSLHPYQYAYSQPTLFTDPSGLNAGGYITCAAISQLDTPLIGPADAAAIGCLIGVGLFDLFSNPATWTSLTYVVDTCAGILNHLQSRSLTPGEEKHIERINEGQRFLNDHPDIASESEHINKGGEPNPSGKGDHVSEAVEKAQSIQNSQDTLKQIPDKEGYLSDVDRQRVNDAINEADRILGILEKLFETGFN